jgi:hypothetical protein
MPTPTPTHQGSVGQVDDWSVDMGVVGAHGEKTDPPELLQHVEYRETVIITCHGRGVARLASSVGAR